MAIAIFPEAAASSGGASTASIYGFTIPAAYTDYAASIAFESAVYDITCAPTSDVVTYTFLSGSSVLLTGTTSSGNALNLNLGTGATTLHIKSTAANTAVTITKKASNLPGTALSGTLDTITSSGTYNQTGKLYVLAVGGGAGGGGGNVGGYSEAGNGGHAGAVTGYLGFFNTATSVTVGARGNGNAANSGRTGNAGGGTTFGNVVSAAGGGAGASGTGGNGGVYEYGGRDAAGPSSSVINPALSVKTGNNGGGGGGNAGAGGSNGSGSGIGTGGNSGGGNATGYGAGGGGGNAGQNSASSGGAGASGVVYVLRGF